jgi:phosphoenolpyruvate carboxykinase (GTP)
MTTSEAKAKLNPLFEGSMKGRSMYVVPYLLSPKGCSIGEVGVQLTDSPYVVANMSIMTRMGSVALDALGDSNTFVKGVHSLGDLSPDRRFICQFPLEDLILSVGSGYGGNALLSKKCHSLRIASVHANRNRWLAEHMLIIGVEEPGGTTTYVTAAFPSASGKTNLAMLRPPERYKDWKIWTVGDDIAWMRIGSGGRLMAVNPEAGFFGVAPGTGAKTNPVALETLSANSIFTNVGLTPEQTPWWEGLSKDPPPAVLDWQGRQWKPDLGTVAHPNSRFTTPISQCTTVSPKWDDPAGVPVSAMLFGGRRASLVPLVFEAFDWNHGVYIGATMGVETTAAATGQIGVVRRDPMAMLPFTGYNISDYLAHWIRMGTLTQQRHRIFHVNWFRKDAQGNFIWPGFGDNLRVLRWIIQRCRGEVEAVETPIGLMPSKGSLDLGGLDLNDSLVDELLKVDREGWLRELEDRAAFLQKLGPRLPKEIWDEHHRTKARLEAS